ncbi:MAG: PHP domain-containing protein [Nitrospirales bacterium]
MTRIDLHLHSTYSDGSCSPAEVVRRAHRSQVSALALTDHDTTDGLAEASIAAAPFHMEIISGVEISSLYKGQETHILGYFINHDDPQLQQRLASLRNSRHERIPKIISKLKALGLNLSYDDVKAAAGPGSIGRPHIAQVLVEKQYVRNGNEAFSRYLAEGSSAFVARTLPDVAEAIRWIRECGGVASLAHPNWVRHSLPELRVACEELKSFGLEGVEVFYSSHSPRQTSDYLTLARQLELLVTGGSDFHGTAKPDIEVGIGKGNLKIPEKILEELRACAHENRKASKPTRAIEQ